jgi:hypothetical protein
MPNHSSLTSPPPQFKMRPGLLRPVAVVLLLAGAGLACSLIGGSSTSTSSPANRGAGSLNNPAAGLEGLSSYRATLHLEFDGTQDGAPLAWSQALRLESDRTASARLLSIDRRGPDASQDADGILIGQFGSMTITRPAAEGACQGEVGETPLVIPEPASLLRPIQQSITYSGSPEERNGLSTLHAVLDARAVGASSEARVKGEMWVAEEGGYIVRYILEIDGTPDDWGKGIEGVMRWEYNLDEVGQELGLLPPPGCPLGMVDAPLPDDATGVEAQPGILTLTTGLDVAAAAEFYQDRLPGQGWSESDTAFLTPRAARLTFLQPGRQLVILIQAGLATQISITLENPAAPAPQTGAATATPDTGSAVEPMARVLASLNNLLYPGAVTPAFPSYHLEVDHKMPLWAGGKLDQSQEMLSADVQGKDVHFTDHKTTPGKPAKTAEAYLINDNEYVVTDGVVTPGPGLTSLAWDLWPMDAVLIISVGSQGTTPAGTEVLEGRTAEVYNLDGSGALGGGAGVPALPGIPVTAARGKVWVDQETGALLKAVLDYEADVRDSSGATRGSGSGHLEIAVTQVGNVTVTLPGR